MELSARKLAMGSMLIKGERNGGIKEGKEKDKQREKDRERPTI